jgi:RNA polymerase sigma factor (sigma-70 family)
VRVVASDQRFSRGDDLTDLVEAALAGHAAAWSALVERLERVVWKAVNMMTTDHEVRNDAFAATWLRLAERLDTIREPHKLPGWLATTATNEVRQIIRQQARSPIGLADVHPGVQGGGLGDLLDTVSGDDDGDHERELVARDDARDVRAAFVRLDDGCRQVITVLVLTDPPLAYDQASELLGRPIGSLGPTRKRCLEKMRKLLDAEEGT